MKIVAISRPDPPISSSIQTENLHGRQDLLDKEEIEADAYDRFNRPRQRRNSILSSLATLYPQFLEKKTPTKPLDNLNLYKVVHDTALVDFLQTAWNRWIELGPDGRDPQAFHPTYSLEEDEWTVIPPLVPIHCMLQRDGYQVPSTHVIGQMAYYCTDHVTPIVSTLVEELTWDGAVVDMAVHTSLQKEDSSSSTGIVYAITTHPGHHCSYDVFGGYCYLNHAALAATLFQQQYHLEKVAILDVDYHCGNGTASIFYHDSSVLVISLHCDPNYDYPFNSGFADQTGAGEGIGTTLHIPLKPGTTWKDSYETELSRAMDTIVQFGTQALIVSIGLDTYDGDPVAIRRAGFHLSGKDYIQMGKVIGEKLQRNNMNIPIVFIQEGGYKMDVVGDAAAMVVGGCAEMCMTNERYVE